MTNHFALDEGGSRRAELGSLDPDLDSVAEERFAASVATRIDSRAVDSARPLSLIPIDPLYGLWSLPRPFLIAASIVAVAILGVASRSNAMPAGGPATVAESIGVPSQLLASGNPQR
jgi:hypothetical protein